MKKITSQDLNENITNLKKIFGKCKAPSRLYALYDEQKSYIRKLRIIFSGFHDYLSKEKSLSQNVINQKIDAVQTYLQQYHLGYSEVGLSELDSSDFSAFFEYFVAQKWFGITKSEFKSLCPSLKAFVEFLRDKLNYYQEESVYNDIIDSLNSELYRDLIFKENDEDDVDGPTYNSIFQK